MWQIVMQAFLQDGLVRLPLLIVLLIAHCHLPLTSSITSVLGWRLPHALLDPYKIIHTHTHTHLEKMRTLIPFQSPGLALLIYFKYVGLSRKYRILWGKTLPYICNTRAEHYLSNLSTHLWDCNLTEDLLRHLIMLSGDDMQ